MVYILSRLSALILILLSHPSAPRSIFCHTPRHRNKFLLSHPSALLLIIFVTPLRIIIFITPLGTTIYICHTPRHHDLYLSHPRHYYPSTECEATQSSAAQVLCVASAPRAKLLRDMSTHSGCAGSARVCKEKEGGRCVCVSE